MTKMGLENIFSNNSGFLPVSEEKRRETCAPNSLYYNKRNNVAVIVAFRSPRYSNFSVNMLGVHRIRDLRDDGKISNGYVLLADGSEDEDANVVNYKTITEFLGSVCKFNPQEDVSNYGNGEFWVMDDEFVVPERYRKRNKPRKYADYPF